MTSQPNTFNYPGQTPSQSGGIGLIQSGDEFKYKLLEVGISEGQAKEIDQFFFNELSIANFPASDREYIIKIFKALRMYLYASKENPRSKRTYSLIPNILRCYERARVVAITTKGLEGWGMKEVLHPRISHYTDEKITTQEYKEEQRKKFFGLNDKNKEGLTK